MRAAVFLGCIAAVVPATGQQTKPLMAEQAFKNVTVLKGVPVKEFLTMMGFFSASLGESCTYCHVTESGGNWAKYADDNEHKQTARRMIGMVSAINKTYFGGRRELTCYSCHRGGAKPRLTPNLADLYGPPHIEEPDEFVEPRDKGPTATEILDQYIEAIGGAERVSKLERFTAKGGYQGFSDPDKIPVELFAKAPAQRTTVVHTPNGDSTTVFDGRNGWIAAPSTDSPIPVIQLTGGELDGARLDAELSFPARIKQTLSQWRAGYPANIDGKQVNVVQGTFDGRYPVNLYFDSKSLLVRLVRYADSAMGLNPTQIDYADYRDVAGVKMPFRWTVTWLDGRSNFELIEVRPNVPVEASRFAKPAPPPAPRRSK